MMVIVDGKPQEGPDFATMCILLKYLHIDGLTEYCGGHLGAYRSKVYKLEWSLHLYWL
jgi:hypothetical protein